MKKYNVGIVGYGWVATAHIPAINATLARAGHGSLLLAQAGCGGAERSSTAAGSASITTWTRCSPIPDIHVVSLCGLPTQRLDQAVRAARAGKHLILEKPLCLSLKELRAMHQAVRQAKVKTCVCFECRFASQFQVIKAVLDRACWARCTTARWIIITASARGMPSSAGAGARTRAAVPCSKPAAMRWMRLLLCMGSEVVEVMSYGTKSKSKVFAPYEYPSTSVTILKFKNGAVGKCASSIDCLQPYYFHTHLVGSKGSLLDNKFHSSDLGTNKAAWSALAMKLVDSGDVSDHPYQAQFDAFFNALDQGQEMPLTSLDDAVISHEVDFRRRPFGASWAGR